MQFLRNAHDYYASLGVRIRHLLNYNGPAFRSMDFARACAALGIKHKLTHPYRPQTNGKAERFIESTLREWAYGFTYQNSMQRTPGSLESPLQLAPAVSGYQRRYTHISPLPCKE